ncbi:hypothetical protein DUI87_10399 [Hirundo rustica rustica]|uniref:Uncharacterized protein n=2 Tax=Passeriformes TaxID=9126 RepID=A0A3M0KNQ0_HIRRU|nr:hypothetical protein DUI87_10399 [Hirundo rustica rustica]
MALVPCQVLRAAILLSYCSILCNYKAIDMPAHQTYGGSWKFLTFIDLVIQAVFFGICVLTDLSSLLTRGNDSQEQERQLKKLISLRDWMMAVLAFPVGVFVVTMFWSIYIYDRELVYPKLLDNFIPAWLNHGMPEISQSLFLTYLDRMIELTKKILYLVINAAQCPKLKLVEKREKESVNCILQFDLTFLPVLAKQWKNLNMDEAAGAFLLQQGDHLRQNIMKSFSSSADAIFQLLASSMSETDLEEMW